MKRAVGFILWVFTIILFPGWCDAQQAPNAQALIAGNLNYMRGKTSVSTVVMTIHRPDWQRVSTIRVWTRGEKDSLFTITDPPKDRGNGTLKLGRKMWTFNPKINRVIKIPPSMMSQAWMGSDFSNNDLAKTDSVVEDYDHTITGTETHGGKTVYLIRSIPKPDAAVVWGMLTFKIREDLIPLEEIFYDEDLQPVKILTFSRIEPLGGKLFKSLQDRGDFQGGDGGDREAVRFRHPAGGPSSAKVQSGRFRILCTASGKAPCGHRHGGGGPVPGTSRRLYGGDLDRPAAHDKGLPGLDGRVDFYLVPGRFHGHGIRNRQYHAHGDI